jgi:hypothetical protein
VQDCESGKGYYCSQSKNVVVLQGQFSEFHILDHI